MSIAKVDIDIRMDHVLFLKFLQTRLAIVETLGYHVKHMKRVKTTKGDHVWVQLDETLTDKELCDLQFLLGDDQPRCRFNYLRNDAGVMKHFNALFSKKLKRYPKAKGGQVEA